MWYVVAATYDGGTARVYVNRVLDAEAEFGAPIKLTAEPPWLWIGNDHPGAEEVLDGAIDEVMIWDEPRSAEQIYDDMLGGGPDRDELGLMAHYTFDEFGSNLIIDHSGGGRHARLGWDYDVSARDPRQVLWNPGTRTRYMRLSSTMPGDVEGLAGDPGLQLNCLNCCSTQEVWQPIVNRHRDFHQRGQFPCDGSLDGPFVDTETFLTGADEVTRHNCESGFYRWQFHLPPIFENGAIYGVVNTDDMGVAFLNRVPISAEITQNDIDDLGTDRVNTEGHPLLSWPTADGVYSLDHSLLAPGANELILAVGSDFSEFEPAGAEFLAVVRYDRLADWNGDGAVNTIDFLTFLNHWNDRLPEADVNADGVLDTRDVRDCLNTWTFGCPE